MTVLLWQSTARHLLRHPWQLALALFGIALGVAVVCAVQLTQASARQSLAYAQRALLGNTTHRIEAVEGFIDEQAFATFALDQPALTLVPVVSGEVDLVATHSTAGAHPLSVLGVDPLVEAEDGNARRRLGTTLDLGRFLSEPDAVWINAASAQRHGLESGGRFRVRAGGREAELTLAGLAADARDGGPADDVLVMDIASAQELLGLAGRLSAIEVRLPRGASVAGLRAALPAGWRLESRALRLASAREVTRSFDVNLTALSLLALVVGMFLIHNTTSFLVLQRQRLFAQLRALGVSRRELLSALVAEALLLGALGTALGLALGRGIAGLLLQGVGRTVNDLYYRAAITEVATPLWLLGSLAVVGIGTTLLAALPPILEVAHREVVAAGRLDAGTTRRRPARLLAGALALWALAALLLALPTRELLPGFGALFACLLGAALLVPWLLDLVTARVGARANSPAALLGLRMLSAYGRRTGLAAAALMAACATGIAVTVMVASFRVSVTEWLAALLRADVYVNLPAAALDGQPTLAELRQRIDGLPEVAATSAVVRASTRMTGRQVTLFAYDLPPAARPGFRFLAGDADRVWRDWDAVDSVIVTESFAWRHRVAPGASLRLETPRGEVEFRITGVYRDYSSERGSVAMSRQSFLRHYAPRDDVGLGVYAARGTDGRRLEQALRRAVFDVPGLRLQSNATIRELSLAVFDQTFRVTELLRGLALSVAFVGIVSALLAQQMERITDYALMRALGFTRTELAGVVLLQTLAAGVIAASLAVPVGVGLALLLIDVINVRSFGWTMSLHLPTGRLFAAWAAAIVAAGFAALGPALLAARRAPATVLRND